MSQDRLRHAASVAGVWGITWWCSHDVSRSLLDFPEVEYDLGLFTSDRELKPTGRRFGELAAELRGAPAPEPVAEALVLDDVDATGAVPHREACGPGGAFFEAWMRHAERVGRGPQIVLRSSSQDAALLAARGIRHVVEVAAV